MATRKTHEMRAKRALDFFQLHNFDKRRTVQHFVEENMPRSTIYSILDRFSKSRAVNYKRIPGKKASVLSSEKLKQVKRLLRAHPNISMRELRRKCGISHQNAHRAKSKLGFKTKKAKPTAKLVKDQGNRIKKGANKIYKKLVRSGGQKILIMDDETYVAQDPTQVPQDKFNHEESGRDLPMESKTKPKTKFFKKFLVWQAIDQNGNVSEPYISEWTINGQIYLDECLKKRLLPFIKQHYNIQDVLFWPDLATSHYAHHVQAWLRSEKIETVSAKDNPPNWPFGRPIERFWALCKRKYGQRKRSTKDLKKFKTIWKDISREVAKESGKNLMVGIKRKMYMTAKNGVIMSVKLKPLRPKN